MSFPLLTLMVCSGVMLFLLTRLSASIGRSRNISGVLSGKRPFHNDGLQAQALATTSALLKMRRHCNLMAAAQLVAFCGVVVVTVSMLLQ